MATKTTRQWRREVPAYDRLIRDVEALIASWPGQPPRIIAHLNPDTIGLSIILDGTGADCATADRLLIPRGYRPGWKFDTTVHPVWRKAVAR